MSDKILDGAKVCASMIFEAVFKFGLEEKVRAEHPDIRVPLSVLTLTWLVPALDYVMSGEGRVTRQHRSFINEALATDFAVADLDAATSSEGGIGIPFNATVVPAFLLLADRVEPGAAEHLCLPIARFLSRSSGGLDSSSRRSRPRTISSGRRKMRPNLPNGNPQRLMRRRQRAAASPNRKNTSRQQESPNLIPWSDWRPSRKRSATSRTLRTTSCNARRPACRRRIFRSTWFLPATRAPARPPWQDLSARSIATWECSNPAN